MSAHVTDVLNEAVAQFHRASCFARELDEKSNLVSEVTAAEAKAQDAAKREIAALAAAEVAKAEAEAAR